MTNIDNVSASKKQTSKVVFPCMALRSRQRIARYFQSTDLFCFSLNESRKQDFPRVYNYVITLTLILINFVIDCLGNCLLCERFVRSENN